MITSDHVESDGTARSLVGGGIWALARRGEVKRLPGIQRVAVSLGLVAAALSTLLLLAAAPALDATATGAEADGPRQPAVRRARDRHPRHSSRRPAAGADRRRLWRAELAALIVRIGEMITYQGYNTKSPLNGLAARRADENVVRLPIRKVDLGIDAAMPDDRAGGE